VKATIKKRLGDGFVYLIRSENGLVKLGASLMPRWRLKSLSCGSPLPLELLHIIATNDMTWLEATLHERFREKRARGEWFRLSEEDVSSLLAVGRMDGPTSAARPLPRQRPLAAKHNGRRSVTPRVIGQRIRYFRREKSWSQGQLARRAGIDRRYLSAMERGVRDPGLSSLIAIADALRLSMDNLLGRTPPAA
jgi:DNA-binding XRE family transcriptional regulator